MNVVTNIRDIEEAQIEEFGRLMSLVSKVTLAYESGLKKDWEKKKTKIVKTIGV